MAAGGASNEPSADETRATEEEVDNASRSAQAGDTTLANIASPDNFKGYEGPEKTGSSQQTVPIENATGRYITRAKDGLVIPVGTATEASISSTNPLATANDTVTPATHRLASQRTSADIDLVHEKGDRFVVPWALCYRWTGLKDIIKLTYGENEEAKKEIDEGKYEIWKGDAKILREHWDMLIEPWYTYTIKLYSEKNPMDPDYHDEDLQEADSKPSEEKVDDSETKYRTTLKYRLDCFVKPDFPGPDLFIESKTYDSPIMLETLSSDARELAVLDEIKTITFGSQNSLKRKNQGRKDKLKVGMGDVVRPKKLHIRSPLLLNALRSIVKYASNPPAGDSTDVFIDGMFTYPFRELFHHRQELLDFKKETTGPRANHTPKYNAQCDEHIDTLIEYLDNEPSIQLKSVEAKWKQKVPITTFSGLWLLMKPGTDVYIEEDGQLNAYVIDLVTGGVLYSSEEGRSSRARPYYIRAWNLIYDGKLIKRRAKTIEVPVFDGEREIASLPLFPTRFHDRLDDGARRKQLIERGAKFFQYTKGPTFLEYSGLGLKVGWKKYSRSRVVVEHESQPWRAPEFYSLPAWRFTDVPDLQSHPKHQPPPAPGELPKIGERARGPRCECAQCKVLEGVTESYVSTTFSDYDNIDPKRTQKLSEHQSLLCMSHMFAFILKDRTYDIVNISGLNEPRLVENAIDRLVMRPEKNKSTIKAIVKTYAESDTQGELFSADFIQGKGEGQIFLLHGPPGTGKTLTAESVAEYTKRPLLSITAADLGDRPIDLERNLLRFFNNATNWDAIVLLDEADIYLERRSSNDLERNSIVSIFLRAMDYYQGILFLTTNRVGHFDEAFMSRIHVSIGYDPLDDKAREQIWTVMFQKLKEDHKHGGPEIRYEYDAKQYVQKSEDVRKLQWNGREIRNAFQTAVALAIFDSRAAREKGADAEDCIPQVTEAHLSQVVSMSAAFKRYIKSTHEGIEDADLAYRLGNRNDRLGPETS